MDSPGTNRASHPKISHEARVLEREGALSPEARAERLRAFDLLAEHWSALAPQVRRWLGTAVNEDDAWLGEVALVMARRIRFGNGIVAPLRDIPPGDPREKGLLFASAKFATADVVKLVKKDRDRRLRETDSSSLADREADDGAATLLLDRSIAFLLRTGEEVWGQLCDAGVLRSSDWTEDEKWTAIGMMWGLDASRIAVIRFTRAKAPREVLDDDGHSTCKMMKAVRRKGKRLLSSMSEPLRCEYGLPPPTHREEGEGRST